MPVAIPAWAGGTHVFVCFSMFVSPVAKKQKERNEYQSPTTNPMSAAVDRSIMWEESQQVLDFSVDVVSHTGRNSKQKASI